MKSIPVVKRWYIKRTGVGVLCCNAAEYLPDRFFLLPRQRKSRVPLVGRRRVKGYQLVEVKPDVYEDTSFATRAAAERELRKQLKRVQRKLDTNRRRIRKAIAVLARSA